MIWQWCFKVSGQVRVVDGWVVCEDSQHMTWYLFAALKQKLSKDVLASLCDNSVFDPLYSLLRCVWA